MALILKDRVQETSTTTGTGTLTLAGAVTQFQTFSSAIGNGNTTYYTIYNSGGSLWEVGIGTVGAGTLSRDTVLASSNSGSLVSFTGTLYVFGDYPAGKAVYLDSINTATVPQLATSATTSTTPVLSFNASNSGFASGATISGSYLQSILQNKSGTAGASTNYVLSNDLGTDSTYYGEFGMNSSVYSSGTPADFFSLNNGVYFSGHDGPVSVGSGNGQNLYLTWGTTGQSAHVINTTGAIGLNTNITGTSNFGTAGQVLTSQGSATTPTWTTPTTGTVTSVSGTTGRITSTGGATPVIDLASGVATAGTTGSSTLIPVITIDTYGRVTSITTASNPQGTVTSVTGTAPVVSSGGATPAISMAAANGTTNGYLTSTDWTTFNNKGSGTVTSVAALTLGTTGTDLSSSVATGTTTPVITLNVPTASATNRGVLSSADWTTFNNKGSGTVTSVAQSFTGGIISVGGSPVTTTGTLALTVAGTSGGIPYFSSATTWATSAALASNALVVGGGAGVAPSTITTGTGVVTALGVNTGTTGAFVVNGGALGTPSSGTVTNLTGTASININGTVGATTASTGAFTTLSANSTVTFSGTTTNIAATSQTSGTITIGGTAGTGALTFGSSTASQTTNLANGVTASGNTNTIAVGNNGASGSTTTITIGSASGTSSTTLKGSLIASSLTGILVGNGASAITTITPGTGVSTALGVAINTAGGFDTIDGTATLTNKWIQPRVSTTTSSATPTINTDTTDQFGLTAQAVDITSFTTNLSGTPVNGQKLWIYIVGTAARAITWGASFEASTVALPTTTVTTKRLDVGFVWNAASSVWRCVAVA